MPLLQDQNEKAIREQQKLSLWSTDCEEQEGEREKGRVAPCCLTLSGQWLMKSKIKARGAYKYSMSVIQTVRGINLVAGTYISDTAHCAQWPSPRSCAPERTTPMCCPNNDIPWPNLWQIWHPNWEEAVDRQRGRRVPAVRDARSNRSNCQRQRCHHRTPPWIALRRAAGWHPPVQSAMWSWRFCGEEREGERERLILWLRSRGRD